MAFIVIYFAVFGAGVVYILRLMAHAPEIGETGPGSEPGPIRSSGITPAAQVAESRPRSA
jgi:cytochrome d ubiquinol oxidase subunit I